MQTTTYQRFVQPGKSPVIQSTAHPFNALGPLIDREKEVDTLRSQLLDPMVRVISLTGPSGVGKSRLAAALFNDVHTAFSDGGHFVDLANLTDEDELPASLMSAIDDTDAVEEATLNDLTGRLGDREVLLVIDQCEHMIASVAATISTLLVTCPRLRVLISSQEPSRIYGGNVFGLAPLDVPDQELPDDPAELERIGSVALFVMRTRAVRPDFRLTARNQEIVAELCRKLDGLPLAIELAAAKMKLLTPEAILEQLGRGLACLRTGRGDTLSRHMSMEEAIRGTCARLTTAERSLLGGLSVFSGEFGLKTAEAVIRPPDGSVQDLLESLVDKNLLVPHDVAGGELGFSMLNTTRAYAFGQLTRSGELECVKRSHATYFLATVQAIEPELDGRDQQRWFTQLQRWDDELRAVFSFFTERGEPGKVATLAAALRPYWFVSGRLREGLDLLTESRAMGGLTEGLEAKTLDAAGEIATFLGDPAAGEHLERALDLYGTLRDHRGAAACTHHLGRLAHLSGELDTARHLLEKGMSARKDAGDIGGYAAAACDLARLLCDTGEYAAARKNADAALRALQKMGNRRGVAIAYYILIDISIRAADGALDDRAEEMCREATQNLHDLGERPMLIIGLELSAILLSQRSREREGWRRAVAILSAARTLREEIDHPPALEPQQVDEATERARVRLGADAFRAAWAEGRRFSLRAAVGHALSPVTWEPAAVQRLDLELDTPLTPREHEVAELVAYGLTNRKIARRLGIAEWTAVNHLRKVMQKLNCSSRVQVANWVMNHRDQ